MESLPPSPSEGNSSVSPLPNWETWCQCLPETKLTDLQSDHFQFYGLIRNHRNATQFDAFLRHGVHGLRDPELAIIVRDTLEMAYQKFLLDGRGGSIKDSNDKISVYLFAVDDPAIGCGSPLMTEMFFVALDRLVPVIVLASRSDTPDRMTEISKARASAVHELSHFFNAAVLPYRRRDDSEQIVWPPTEIIEGWLWLDEALALDAEMEILPEIDDWLSFSLDWVDRPEFSLDHPDARYQAVFFIRYLRAHLGFNANQFFANLWKQSSGVWEAVDPIRAPVALTALADSWPENLPTFCSATEHDFFASGFCYDSYFLDQPNRSLEFPKIFRRFGGRAIEQTWNLASATAESRVSTDFSLAGLACYYIRFIPISNEPSRLSIQLRTDRKQSLKAELVAVNVSGSPIGSRMVAMREIDDLSETLSCQIDDFSRQSCDHVILVVTNCLFGTNANESRIATGFQHKVNFELTAELLASL